MTCISVAWTILCSLWKEKQKYRCSFGCRRCDKAFRDLAKIKRHVFGHHLKVSTFVCDDCGKGFYEKRVSVVSFAGVQKKGLYSRKLKFLCLSCRLCCHTRRFTKAIAMSSPVTFVVSNYWLTYRTRWKTIWPSTPVRKSLLDSKQNEQKDPKEHDTISVGCFVSFRRQNVLAGLSIQVVYSSNCWEWSPFNSFLFQVKNRFCVICVQCHFASRARCKRT